jgi:hypothetical protein
MLRGWQSLQELLYGRWSRHRSTIIRQTRSRAVKLGDSFRTLCRVICRIIYAQKLVRAAVSNLNANGAFR